ncbi:MAG: hypothetical protein GEU99_16130 [Luteitalea sp.]|nr:hypothetical protein [Luteitalea sp.]
MQTVDLANKPDPILEQAAMMLVDEFEQPRGWATVHRSIVRPAAEGGDFLVINVGSNRSNYRIRELAEAVRACLGDVDGLE